MRGVLEILAVEGYRSLRRLVVPLGEVTVVTGPNGSGKSSLYRTLRLLADVARNGAVGSLAREGGLPSTLWAGPEKPPDAGEPVQGTVRKGQVGLRLGFSGSEFGYAVDLGLPKPSTISAFTLDPEIKVEAIWSGPRLRPSSLLSERAGPTVRIREGKSWRLVASNLKSYDSMLSEVADPEVAPEILRVREQVRSWRFYDHFPTDPGAPARLSPPATRTPRLAADGGDLAAALQTIIEVGDAPALEATIESAFPGSRLEIGTDRKGWLELGVRQPGMLRPLGVAELSEGTLRYLLLAAALLSPRPPELLVLNEPEAHLDPSLLAPLAELIVAASAATQLIVVSHARALVDALGAGPAADEGTVRSVRLVKEQGETRVEGLRFLDEPPWEWPKR